MKLKTFKCSEHKIYSTKMTVSFSKYGVITFSRSLTKSLDVKKGEYLEIAQDEDTPQDWYLRKGSGDSDHFRINGPKAKKYKSLYLCSAGLGNALRKSLNITLRETIRFPVSEPNQEGWHAILTKSIEKEEVLNELNK